MGKLLVEATLSRSGSQVDEGADQYDARPQKRNEGVAISIL